MRSLHRGFLLFALLAALPAICVAQFETATVLGTVKDASGSAVVGCKVTLENVKTGVTSTATTTDRGGYDFLNVHIGAYRVRAEFTGFKSAVTEVFTVTVSARQKVDVVLELGEVKDTITVTDSATTLESESSDRGQVINNVTITNLPLNGRSYADLALLTPGVRKSYLAMDQSSSNYRESSFNVNGQRSAFNNFQVDGVDNNAYNTSNQGYSNQAIQLSPDAVAEFKVQTNNFSAEYGRAGGAIVNVSLKGGTNEFHGAAWDYIRNTKLNAVGFFKPKYGKPVFQQNQFGGVFGGPVVKNKTFFFVDYEGLRRTTRTLSYQTLPTLDQRNGIFKDEKGNPIAIENPYTGQTYADGVIPQSEISPFAKKVFGQLVAPTYSGIASNYEAMPRIPSSDNKGDARVDQYFSSRLVGFFRYSHRNFVQTDNPVLPLPVGADSSNGNVTITNKQAAGGVTYTIGPTSLIEFRLGVTRSIGGKYPLQLGTPGMLEAYGIPGLPEDPSISGGLNTQSISGYTSMGRRGSTPQFQNPTVINPKVNFSKIFSRHTLKLGAEYQMINTDLLDFSPQYGGDNYNGQFSKPASAKSNNVYNIADFLFGARSVYQLTNWFTAKYRQRMYFGYVQDDWKVNSKLTVNLGVRYEFATPQWEDGMHLSNFDPANNRLIQASSGDIYSRALVHPDRNNWAPRVGLAYSLNSKTVIRAGYGISYIHFNRLGGENILSYNPPSVVTISVNNPDPLNAVTCATDVALDTCFRPTALGYTPTMIDPNRVKMTGVTLRYTPPETRTGYVQSWHFTIQRELAKDLLFDVAYVGNHSVKLISLADLNQARPQAAGEKVSLNDRRPYTGYGEIEISWNDGYAMYDALQAKLEKKFNSGLYLLNSFTFSKVIDNAAGHLETAGGDSSRINYLDPNYNRGVGSYNQPFNNTTTVVYDVPYGKGRRFGAGANPIMLAVLGGWRTTLINTMTSGLPMNLTYDPASNYSVSGMVTYRPSLLGDPMAPEGQRNINNYFNKANVVSPLDYGINPLGNSGRNNVRGYAFYQADLGLHKDFPLWESKRLEFRSEFFNVLNKTNFQTPNANRSSSSFGKVTSAFPARMIQLALKFVF